jgi:hypothetical protein
VGRLASTTDELIARRGGSKYGTDNPEPDGGPLSVHSLATLQPFGWDQRSLEKPTDTR